jgi:DNA-binding transcriptional LysR family regulator
MPWTERTRRRLKLRDIDILIAVAATGSMSKAAQQLNMFQPAISKAIADLEAALGVRLLDRNRQGVEPTPYGLALIKRGPAVFDELKQAVQEIDFLRGSTAGELRLGGQDPMAGGVIPAVIARLAPRYPAVVFNVTIVQPGLELYRPLRERTIEFQLGRVYRPDLDPDLSVEYLFDEPLVIAAGNESRWARRRQIELAELIDEPWVFPQPDHQVGRLITELFRSAGVDWPKNGVICSSLQMNEALLATGRYLACYPGSFLKLNARRQSIKILPVRLPKRSMPVGIATLKNRTLSPIAKLFIEEAKKTTGAFGKIQ